MNDALRLALAYRTPLEDSLIGISAALTTELSVEAVLDHILEQARLFTHAEAGTIYLVESDHLRFAVVQNEPLAARFGPRELRRRLRSWPLPLSQPSLPTHVALTGATLNVEDAYANHMLRPLFEREADGRDEYQTRSLLAVPLCTPAGNVIGVLELINAQRSPGVVVPFLPEHEPLVRAFASLAAVAVHRAILDETTFKDTLTDLYNRRYLGLRLEEEAGRHTRFGHPVSVVTVDLDNFERVNRRAGQSGGDAVLREIGVLLRKNTRKFTVLARDRGDDFTIVLSNTTRAGAAIYAERIRQVIARHHFEHGAITASLGVASLPESVNASEELVTGAYQSVAEAKRGGGNQVGVL